MNLAGIKKSDITRGDTIAKPGSMRVSLMLDVRLQNLRNSQRTIVNGSQVHLYHGSAVRLAKVVLLDRDALQPGESAYAQLRLTEEIATRQGDRFVIRFYSPLETIGGGVILDDHPYRHKRNDAQVLKMLAVKESGSDSDKLVQAVAEYGTELVPLQKLADRLSMDAGELEGSLEDLCGSGKLIEPLEKRYMASSEFDKVWASCESLLAKYHKDNPLHGGMKVAELRQKLLKGADRQRADAILDCLAREGKIKAVADRYALADFEVRLTKKQNALKTKLLQIYHKMGLEVENLDDVYVQFERNELADCKQVLESLVSGGELVMLTPQLCIERSIYEDIWEKTKQHFAEHEELTLAEFRDMLGTSRKYALAVLEYYDKNKILKKDGDVRRPGPEF